MAREAVRAADRRADDRRHRRLPHLDAKDEAAGYFRGFPIYWNIAAFYAGLTVLPVRFLYPNLAPRRWKQPVLLGAAASPAWLVAVLLVYPAFYATLSVLIDPQRS